MNAQSAAYLTDAYLSLDQPGMAFAEADRFAAEKGPAVVLVKASGLMAALVTRDKAEIEKRLRNLIESESNATISLRMKPLLNDPEGALAELRRMLDDPAFASPFTRNIIAIWAVYFGDLQLAFTLLREFLLSPSSRNLAFLVWRAIYRDVRRLPAFKDLLCELGLVDYWRQTGKWGDFVRPVGDDDFEVIGEPRRTLHPLAGLPYNPPPMHGGAVDAGQSESSQEKAPTRGFLMPDGIAEHRTRMGHGPIFCL
jgi:hypothetical protein